MRGNVDRGARENSAQRCRPADFFVDELAVSGMLMAGAAG